MFQTAQWFARTKVGGLVSFPVTLLWNFYTQSSPGLSWYNEINKNIILGGLPTSGVINDVDCFKF